MGGTISHLVGTSSPPLAAHPDVCHDPPTASADLSCAHTTDNPSFLPLLPLQNRLLLQYTPLKSFFLFPRLPAELRLMVWEVALPGERVVRIQEFTGSSRHDKPSRERRCIGSKSRVPTLLHGCRESRHFALNTYTLTFKNRLLKPTYFNPNLDILLFATVDDFVKFQQPPALYHILRVPSVSEVAIEYFYDTYGNVGRPPRRVTDAEKVEDKLRYLAIGRNNPLPYHPYDGKTPWEEASDIETISLLGEFANLDTLFIEGVYLDDTDVGPAPPPSADKGIETMLKRRWDSCNNKARNIPEIVIVGATMMKQIRFRAREARLLSWARLAEHLP